METSSVNLNGNTAEEVKEEVIKINVTPVAFDSVADVSITTTNELGKIINDIFSQTFKDYYGCNLECQFQPERQAFVIVPRLYFHVLNEKAYTDGDLFAFKPLAVQSNSDMLARVQRLSQISATAGIKVSITDEGKSILEDFVISPNGGDLKKFDWSTSFNSISTESETLIRVFKLDINKFVKKIFGAKDEMGSAYYYQITPTGVINNNVNMQYKKADNWSINILRLNHQNEAKAAELLGIMAPNQSAGPAIITATTKG